MAHETIHLGLYVIFGIIMLPVYVMILGWLIGKPRNYRAVAMAFGYIVGFIALIIAGLLVVGLVTSVFTPY
ncbi:hypothetical protein ACLI4Y_18290 [Natrialbaceae archaeon A-CW3]